MESPRDVTGGRRPRSPFSPKDRDLFSAIDGGTPASIAEAFARFDAANPGIWTMFCSFAHEALGAGAKVLSASLIAERIRWETMIRTSGDDFKINNNFRAFYARKFMAAYPEFDGIFRTRESIADKAP